AGGGAAGADVGGVGEGGGDGDGRVVVVGGDRAAIDADPVGVDRAGGVFQIGAGGDALVGAGVFLQLADGDVERHERVLPGLLHLLAVGGDLGFHPRERGDRDEDQHQERHQRDGDEQGEAALTNRGC